MKKLLPLIATALIGFNAMASTLEIRDSISEDKLFIHEDESGFQFELCESGEECRTLGMKSYTRKEFVDQAHALEKQRKAQKNNLMIIGAMSVIAPIVFFKYDKMILAGRVGARKAAEGAMPASFGFKLGAVLGVTNVGLTALAQEDLKDKTYVTENIRTLTGDDHIRSVEEYTEVLGEVLSEIEMRKL
ncbi:MAG: hypothetical protein BM556_05370 [Bacteriovorax sp. MedPE-SWde]|nr:MAG: hypothetical protein BM556_05370 [Bacteriovorax sp. MedPE-SWde]